MKFRRSGKLILAVMVTLFALLAASASVFG